MKTSLFVALAAALVTVSFGCGVDEIEQVPGEIPPGGYTKEDSQPFPPGVYVTAIDFDKGYDWRRDTTFGLSSGYVKLFKDSTLVLSIPAGPGEEVSLDADKHHFVDGHLYTEYCSMTETVIKRDGRELLRYDGAETLKGILVRDDDIYTLGQGIGGYRGLTLRKNGEILISKEKGTVWGSFSDPFYGESGALYEDLGVMYFSFYTSYKDDSPLAQRRFYLVKNQTISEVWFDETVKVLYDMRMVGGVFLRVVGVGENQAPRLCLDDELKSFSNINGGSGAEGYGIYSADGIAYVFGRYVDKSILKRTYTRKWSLSGFCGSYDGAVASIRSDGDDTVMLMDCGSGSYSLKTSYDLLKFTKMYGYFTPQCMEHSGGVYYIIDNTGADKRSSPKMRTSVGTYEYDVNGILTSVVKQE